MKAIVIALQGLPASGKSTWARQYIEDRQGQVGIVSRDVIRRQVFGVEFQADLEPVITTITHGMAATLLESGRQVLADATNLRREHLEAWSRVAVAHGAGFRVVTMTTPLAVCIARDAQRPHPVGRDIIMRMAAEWCRCAACGAPTSAFVATCGWYAQDGLLYCHPGHAPGGAT